MKKTYNTIFIIFLNPKRLNTARSEKECFCRKDNCFWRGEDRVKCEPDEDVLRAFGIYEIWANLDARRQVELVKQELGDKEEEITLYRYYI